MPVEQLSDIFDSGADVLGTTQDSRGVILAQTGDVVGEEVLSDNAEWWQPVGFCSRPAKAIAGKSACQVVTLNQGSNDICIAARDARCSLPAGVKDGETCVFAGGPNNQGTGKILLADDGSTSTITATSNGSVNLDAPAVNLGNSPTDFVALASPSMANLNALKSAISGAVVVPNDGGASFKATLLAALANWPAEVKAETVKAK